MDLDQLDPNAVEDDGAGEGADRSPPTPEGQEAGTGEQDEAAEKERLKAEIHGLRRQLREEAAEALVVQHGLLPSHAEALRSLPRDQQAVAAERFRQELEQHTSGYDPDLSPARPAPSGAPSGAHVAGDQPGSTAGPTVRTGPQPTDQPGSFADPQTVEDVRSSKNWADLDEARDGAIRRAREANYPNVELDPAKIAEGVSTFDGYFTALEEAKHRALTEARKSQKGTR